MGGRKHTAITKVAVQEKSRSDPRILWLDGVPQQESGTQLRVVSFGGR